MKALSHYTEENHRELLDPVDKEARANNLYGFQILRCSENRRAEITTPQGPRWVCDFATNGPFALNVRKEVWQGAIEAINTFGAVHSSIATARAETGIAAEIVAHLAELKGKNSFARTYPTTFSANIATAAGFAKMDCTAVVHPNVHATVQFALKGAFPTSRLVFSKNTAQVAAAYAKTTRRPVVIVEDGLYSMGKFADFSSLREFLDNATNGFVWLDDAHSVGLYGLHGRGEAMEQMKDYPDRCVVTGSFGKAFGASGGFLVGPEHFVRTTLGVSIADRFSCNLDIGGQGAVLAALKLLKKPGEVEMLQNQLQERLSRIDDSLSKAKITTDQEGTSIAYRVIPFSGPMEAVRAASCLLEENGIMTTPVYYPTIARGKGAIRISFSVGHKLSDVDSLAGALIPLVKQREKILTKADQGPVLPLWS